MKKNAVLRFGLVAFMFSVWALQACHNAPPQQAAQATQAQKKVITGAERIVGDAFGLIAGKKVGLVANHTARVGDVHLLDTLRARGVDVLRIFAPEHGFRGDKEAGASVHNGKDNRTGIPVISLYGKNYKPKAADLADLDAVIWDIQDVGVRFYTYLSTLHYVMEACAEQKRTLYLLDRPNPNGDYVAGQVLAAGHKSFVGMHPVPIVHGLTLGEYARMINAKGWLSGGVRCPLRVVEMQHYRHSMQWAETGLTWVPPSPNLQTPQAARWYPILCWYEGTVVSVGRGTDSAFTVVGMPHDRALRKSWTVDSALGAPAPYHLAGGIQAQAVRFTPRSMAGRAADPMYKNKTCYGLVLQGTPPVGDSLFLGGLELLQHFYTEHQASGNPKPFFNSFFTMLTGGQALRNAIEAQTPPAAILQSWQQAVNSYRNERKKFLMYPE